MSLPQVVVHRIDETSPLAPRSVWYDKQAQVHEKTEMEAFLRDRDIEVIVQVEGVDELTGQALQARHSYRWSDLAFDFTFAPCVQPWNGVSENDESSSWLDNRRCERREGEPICSIDFARFHDIIPAQDTNECPYVSR